MDDVMPTPYQNAVSKRAALKRRIAEIEAELSRIDVFLDMYREFGGDAGQSEFAEASPREQPTLVEAEGPTSRGLRRTEAGPLIRRILVGNGVPMQRGALLQALMENGTPIGGSDPSNNLGTMMWRMKDQFVNIEGHGYWPSDLAFEPASYSPTVRPERDDTPITNPVRRQ